MKSLMIVSFFCFLFSLPVSFAKAEDMVVEEGRLVSFDYTLTVDGEVIDDSKERGPLQYTQGKGEIIPGLARQLDGMQAGEEKLITVSPAEAYGEINPDAIREIDRSELPADTELEAGMMLQVQTKEGQLLPVKILEIKEKSVLLDFNHPLAGKTLTFQVKIAAIQ